MPSVTDLQQQSMKLSSNISGKSTPPPSQQQLSSVSTSQISTDTTNVDPITQAILMLEKKQRNLGKRKVKGIFLFLFIKNSLFHRKNLKVMNKKLKVAKNYIKISYRWHSLLMFCNREV